MVNKIIFSVIFVLISTITVHSSDEERIFRKISDYAGLENAAMSGCYLWNKVVQRKTMCARDCATDDKCVLFKYDKDGNCSAYCDYNTQLAATQDDGSLLYSLKPSTVPEPKLGDNCTDAEQCLLPNTTCNNGQCACQFGYIYNPVSNICQKGCNKYGSNFTVYHDVLIVSHNMQSFEGKTLTWCQNECTTFSPLCPCIEFYDDGNGYTSCDLRDISWFDIEPNERVQEQNINVYQRNCDFNTS